MNDTIRPGDIAWADERFELRRQVIHLTNRELAGELRSSAHRVDRVRELLLLQAADRLEQVTDAH